MIKSLIAGITLTGVVLAAPSPQQSPDIVDVAAEAGSFSTLIAAVEAAGLVEVLKSDGPFTVFAPTDAAFDALPPNVILGLLTDNEALTNVLTYHVAGDSLTSGDLSDGQMITTLNGEDVTVTIMDGTVMINDATVIVADLIGSNGVVHVIDAILLPPPPNASLARLVAACGVRGGKSFARQLPVPCTAGCHCASETGTHACSRTKSRSFAHYIFDIFSGKTLL